MPGISLMEYLNARLLTGEPQLQALRVCGAGRFQRRRPYRMVHDPRPFDVLILCTEGHGWFRQGGREHSIATHDLVWARGDAPHSYGSADHQPYGKLWLSLQGDDRERLLGKCGLSHERPVVTLANGQGFAREWLELIDRLLAEPSAASITHASAKFVEQCQRIDMEHRRSPALKDPLVAEMIRLMHACLDSKLSLHAIATHCGCSVQYCCRRFKAVTGSSPAQHFTLLKIRHAQSLLAEDEPIADIATRLGFCDRHHFSRVFKRVTGLPPTAYRRSFLV